MPTFVMNHSALQNVWPYRENLLQISIWTECRNVLVKPITVVQMKIPSFYR